MEGKVNLEVMGLLSQCFPGKFSYEGAAWDASGWTEAHQIAIDGVRCYLKRIPRRRKEVEYTEAILFTGAVPEIIWKAEVGDDRWFLTKDCGRVNHDGRGLEEGRKIVAAFSAISNNVRARECLSAISEYDPLTGGGLDSFIKVIGCRFSVIDKSAAVNASGLMAALFQYSPKISELMKRCNVGVVHGDLWDGNVALNDKGVTFLDWADVFIGIPGVSLVQYFAQGGMGEEDVDELWRYFHSLQQTDLECMHYRRVCESLHPLLSSMVYLELCEYSEDLREGISACHSMLNESLNRFKNM